MRKVLTLGLLFSQVLLHGQQLDMKLFENLKPRSIGPAGMSGRITAIDAVVSNPDIIYVGAASGGVWKSESGGIAWKPIFDKEGTGSIGSMPLPPFNEFLGFPSSFG